MNTYKIQALTVSIGHVGPGGPYCACCTKGPWSDLKPLIRRAVRRTMRQDDKRQSDLYLKEFSKAS